MRSTLVLAVPTVATALGVATVLAVATALGAQDTLTDQSFAKWRDIIAPTTDELEWRKIGWRAALGIALAEGNRRDKPILLWAMNGHPLGCV